MSTPRPSPFPAPSATTEAQGVTQSDILVRTALIEGLADLRAYPQQLDYVFASLLRDPLTARVYGAKERDRAKAWFLRTEIPVVLDHRLDAVEGSCLSVTIADSTEAEATLADVHYTPLEAAEIAWPTLAGPFDVLAYDPATGIVRLPPKVTEVLVPAPGMVLVDRHGGKHPITETPARDQVVIEPKANADFRGASIKSAYPRSVLGVESVEFRETYRIGIHAHGDPVQVTWLYAVTLFVLLSRRQDLFEARGIERTQLAAGPPARSDLFGGGENFWSRFVDVTGYVRQAWPKFPRERVLSVQVAPLYVTPVNGTATKFVPEPGVSADDASWLAGDPTEPL